MSSLSFAVVLESEHVFLIDIGGFTDMNPLCAHGSLLQRVDDLVKVGGISLFQQSALGFPQQFGMRERLLVYRTGVLAELL